MTELGRAGKDHHSPSSSSSSEENAEDESDEVKLRVAANDCLVGSISHQAPGSIVTFSEGGLPKEEMV